jgi:hypothetical protein
MSRFGIKQGLEFLKEGTNCMKLAGIDALRSK